MDDRLEKLRPAMRLGTLNARDGNWHLVLEAARGGEAVNGRVSEL